MFKKILLFFSLCGTATLSHAQLKPKKVLFVIVDGISANTIEKINTPNLDSISKVGGYSRAYVGGGKGTYSQTPTISAVGYNSLLTGTWVNKHNVWDNDIKDPNYNYWTIFRFLKEQYPHKQTAVFSTWLDNRTKLLGDGLPQTKGLRTDYFFDGMELDTIQFPHDREKNYIHLIDERVVADAAAIIEDKGPDLSWVYLEYTDDMGHRYGDSEQFYKAVEIMDAQMGRLWKAIKAREAKYSEDWQVFITTDHGRDATKGQNHGGQSERERSTWIVTNAQNLNANFQGKEEPGIVDIMPSMARHLDIHFPKEQAFEIDGVPLVGALSVVNPSVKKSGQKLQVSWKAMAQKETLKIWLTTTNLFEEGKQDFYHLVKEVKLEDQSAEIDISKYPVGFYKVVLEGKNNTVNRWIVE
jgi:predicted AlkP superfamily pyrophosphatase or phosphodiesterase